MVRTLKDLCLSYEEISVMKIQTIRDMVVETRDFYSELTGVYYHVTTSYKNQIEKLKQQHEHPSLLIRLLNLNPLVNINSEPSVESGKTDSIVVLLSANTN